MFFTQHTSPLGVLTLTSGGEKLEGLWLEGQKYFANATQDALTEKADLPLFDKTKHWLDAYFSGKKPPLSLPLAPTGSPFRQMVWDMLCAIPYGQCITYGNIAQAVAKRLGKTRMSSQAVGGAVGHNPISIIIPCHRVVGAHGNLTGYTGGLHHKVALLTLEGVDMSGYFVPKTGTAL